MKRADHGPRIALIGTANVDNYGDQLFPVLFQREMERRLPGLAVTLFSPTAGHCRESAQPVHAIQEMPSLFPQGPDAIVVGGGDLIRLDLMPDAFPRWNGPLPSAQMWLLPAQWASDWNVPLLWNAVGVPHAFTAEQAPLVRQACGATDYLAVRDPLSREALEKAGVDQPIAVVPDSGVRIAELFGEADLHEAWQAMTGQPADPRVATLCVQVSPALLSHECGVWISQIKRLLAKRFQRILLLPICNWQGDQEILALLHDQLGTRVDLVRGPTRAVQVAAAIWGSSAFVGSSLHGCLTALSYHKPHLGVGPLAKLRGHFRLLGLPQCALANWRSLAESAHWLLPEHGQRLCRVQRHLSEQVSRHFDELARQVDDAILRKRQTVLRLARTGLDWDALGELTARTCAREATQACQTMSQLGAELATARIQLLKHEAFDRLFGVNCLKAAYRVIRKAPWLHQALVAAGTGWLRLRHLAIQSKNIAGFIARQALQDPVLYGLLRGHRRLWTRLSDVLEYVRQRLSMLDGSEAVEPTVWFRGNQIRQRRLRQYRRQSWPPEAPVFTVVLRLVSEAADHLHDSLTSLANQTYPNWRLLAVAPGPLSTEVGSLLQDFAQRHGPFPILERVNASDPQGDYLCFLDHGDALEPHALHRFAEAVLRDYPDLLYSDEVETMHNLDEIVEVAARPAFSYDHYLSRAYFSHLLGVRADRVRAAGGLGEACRYGQNVDLVLRVLEGAGQVSHVADVLYRHRRDAGYPDLPPPEDQANLDTAAVERHLRRLGLAARVRTTDAWDCREVRFQARPGSRVAIIIPTKNQVQLLSQCVASLRATVPHDRADIIILDHDSDDPKLHAYLQGTAAVQVIPYQGPFNFSAMMNHAVAALDRPYEYYLFLNNDTEATAPGWLEHMLGLAQREEVGAVGALLLYPDGRVQHAGVMVGMHFAADHAPKSMPAYTADGIRLPGPQASLLTVRDQSAVTGACLLVRAELFHQEGGFDERFAVGFGDTDLCLRLRAKAYKILMDPHAVLLHHESATRGKLGADPHPADTVQFREKYLDLILDGDPFHSPLHSRYAGLILSQRGSATRAARPCSIQVCLPQSPRPAPLQPQRRAA